MIDHDRIMQQAKEIGNQQGKRSWNHVRPFVLGGSVPSKSHYDNASTIIYAIEEEDPTTGILPRPSLGTTDSEMVDSEMAACLQGHAQAPSFTMQDLAEELDISSDRKGDSIEDLRNAEWYIRQAHPPQDLDWIFWGSVADWFNDQASIHQEGTKGTADAIRFNRTVAAARSILEIQEAAVLQDAAKVYVDEYSRVVEAEALRDARSMLRGESQDPDSLPGGHDYIRDRV